MHKMRKMLITAASGNINTHDLKSPARMCRATMLAIISGNSISASVVCRIKRRGKKVCADAIVRGVVEPVQGTQRRLLYDVAGLVNTVTVKALITGRKLTECTAEESDDLQA